MTVAQIVILLVRYGLVVLFFPASALDKILNFNGAVKQAKQVFSSNAVAVTLILVGVFVELVMPLGILSGIADRLAAFVMAGYCAVTAMLFKRFWEPGDFWSSGESKGPRPVLGFPEELLARVGLPADRGRAGRACVAQLRQRPARLIPSLRRGRLAAVMPGDTVMQNPIEMLTKLGAARTTTRAVPSRACPTGISGPTSRASATRRSAR